MVRGDYEKGLYENKAFRKLRWKIIETNIKSQK